MSILKLFVMFSSGLSSVCHFGHERDYGSDPEIRDMVWCPPAEQVVAPLASGHVVNCAALRAPVEF
ncbi:MAG: hypothetical protein QOF88_3440 [Mycobacterium sp.]|nr:hypothetical protein [Mycobacterium sp.]